VKGLRAVYPGTFDPITHGHRDIIIRAATVVDHLIIAIASNDSKGPLFTLEERTEMLKLDLEAHFEKHPQDRHLSSKIEICSFSTLLVHFVESLGAKCIIRGLRAVSDFEYEFQMASMNKKLAPHLETLFLTASDKCHFISSRFVKEIAMLGGDISHFTTEPVAKRLRERIESNKAKCKHVGKV
jgi:pantetheine-phosphate adenylyltransferase